MVTAESQPPPAEQSSVAAAPPFVELTLRLPAEWALTWERLCELGELNGLCQLERSCDGGLIVTMPPPRHQSGWIENHLMKSIFGWAANTGWVPFGAAYGYEFPDGSIMIPDLSAIPPGLLPPRGDAAWDAPFRFAPPLVVEVRSSGQSLPSQQHKMERYIINGVRLGWLIDPAHKRIHIYRPSQEAAVLDDPPSLSGEDVMQGLTIDTSDLWP